MNPLTKSTTMNIMKLFSIAIAVSVSTANGFATTLCFHGSRPSRRPQPTTTLGMDSTTREALAAAAVESKGIAMDAIASNFGYLAIPLSDAEIGAVLFGSQVRTRMSGIIPSASSSEKSGCSSFSFVLVNTLRQRSKMD